MFGEVKTAWDKLDPETQGIMRENLSDPEFLNKAIADFTKGMGRDAISELRGSLEAMRHGLKLLTELKPKSPKEWSQNTQEDSDSRHWGRIRGDKQMPGAAQRVLESIQGRIAKAISGEKIKSPRLEQIRERKTRELEKALIELTEETDQTLPESLEELLKNESLVSALGRKSTYVYDYFLNDDELHNRIDTMLESLQTDMEENK